MKKILFLISIVILIASCSSSRLANGFVRIQNGKFCIDEKQYYFVGTNFWYGSILGSTGVGGDRDRLNKELDFLSANGINNLRILVGGDGRPGVPTRIEPTLQIEQGIYNDTIFDGLDYLLSQMGKRNMYAVLYLNNSWEWSGGYSQYLEWAGHGEIPIPSVKGWDAFKKYVEQFVKSDSAKNMFYDHIRAVVGRTNRYTGRQYKDEPSIMAWQIGNEPRAFGDENKEAFAEFIATSAALIKSLDSNHLLSVGSEGERGCEDDIDLWKKIHSSESVDYLTIHAWPYNWSWIDKTDIAATTDSAIIKLINYIDKHLDFAATIGKPLVLEEFGLPRDDFSFDVNHPTQSRDKLYEAIFAKILANSDADGLFAGCNFWAWGGFGRASSESVYWRPEDDYLGDPAQEEQGLNAVFDTDSTVELIRRYVEQINK